VLGAVLRDPATLAEERSIHERSLALLEFVGLTRAATSFAPSRLRRSAPLGDRQAPRHRSEAPRARRAGRRHERDGNRRAGKLLEAIRAQGVTLILIEHDVKLVMGLCDALRCSTTAQDRGSAGRRCSATRR